MAAIEVPNFRILVDDQPHDARGDELLIDVLMRSGSDLPHVCYNPGIGPLKSCDTCLVEIDGRVVRACETRVRDGLRVSARSPKALAGRK
ncbi:MAG: 2Fe-2S iron-sulfur cluster-binding protein, partial [Thermoplasmata archaeon]